MTRVFGLLIKPKIGSLMAKTFGFEDIDNTTSGTDSD